MIRMDVLPDNLLDSIMHQTGVRSVLTWENIFENLSDRIRVIDIVSMD